jgi:predicted O-linked N-acetylglucosamine transferase (SPINDLY family)
MGYTSYNKIKVLAQKPAPIQCEWLGYPNTTGLDAMDYWICDEITNPPGLTDAYYSESLLRLPDCFICFQPPAHTPEPETPPCLTNGYVTFGSFNNYAKVSESLLELWAEILKAVPESHLLLKSACLGNPAQKQQLTTFFKSRNIEAQRIELEGYEPSRGGHLEQYFNMDIALDTFPYNGTTTTCEALWMGVPAITLSGNSHRTRVGKTLLENAGLGELVADSKDNYLKLAVELANNPVRISQYCTTLRATLADSNITDSFQFTRSLEAAYTTIWKKWCDDQA